MALTSKHLHDALRTVQDPDLGKDLVTLGMVKDVEDVSSGVASRPLSHTRKRMPAASPSGSLADHVTLTDANVVSVGFGREVRRTVGGRLRIRKR